MAKFCLKKKSKRQPARLRYKIEKKVRDHNRKLKRNNKKNASKSKREIIQIPNICPFKEEILKEVEVHKKHKEEERRKQREIAQRDLVNLVKDATTRETLHEQQKIKAATQCKIDGKTIDNSLKAYYKEFKKVVDAADVILEVIDARDPLGTKCAEVEKIINDSKGNKKLVLILNKADLIPRTVLDQWLKYLRRTLPTVPFKSSTQSQVNKLGQKKFAVSKETAEKTLKNSTSVGADLLLSLLNNYCRNKGVKTSIRVGVVGLPNVGKSSLINSLKRSKTCSVGATPGVTRSMQEVQLDSKIKLLDSPGIVFSSASNIGSSLRNAINITTLSDPITPATVILQRISKQQIMEIYDIGNYHSPQEFFSLKASRMGRFKKGGIPNEDAAARTLLEDWNRGKIKYYTLPPEDNTSEIHLSSAIISEAVKEFDIQQFQSMETLVLNEISQNDDDISNFIAMDTSKPLEMNSQPKVATELLEGVVCPENQKIKKKKNQKKVQEKDDPETKLEGNLQLNKLKKLQFKKAKKSERKKARIAAQLSTELENFSLHNDEENDFDEA